MTETTLSTKRQIVIPREVREKLKIKAGQEFEVNVMSDGSILVIPIPDDIIDAMRLTDAHKLEKSLEDERLKDKTISERSVEQL